MRHRNKLPREAGEASSLEALKVKLDRALSCGLAEGVPASGREPELPLKIPANPKHFVFLLPHCWTKPAEKLQRKAWRGKGSFWECAIQWRKHEICFFFKHCCSIHETVLPLATKNCSGKNKHNSQSLPAISHGISTHLNHTESLSKHLAMAILKNQNGLDPFEIKNCRLSIKSKSITNSAKKKKSQDTEFV